MDIGGRDGTNEVVAALPPPIYTPISPDSDNPRRLAERLQRQRVPALSNARLSPSAGAIRISRAIELRSAAGAFGGLNLRRRPNEQTLFYARTPAITEPEREQRREHWYPTAAIADGAVNTLPEMQSARAGAARWQKLVGVAAIAGLLAIVLLPDVFAIKIVALVGSLLFLAATLVQLAVVIDPPPPPPEMAPIPDHELPRYGVLVPLTREARIVPVLLDALLRLDYPPEKLDIRIIIEADDRETLAAIEAADPPAWIRVIIAPPGFPRTKPRALNIGLVGLTTEFVVIYDAEDDPDPAQLRLAVAMFRASASRVICLQGHLAIQNTADSVLTALFTLEYAGLFDVIKPGLARLGLPIPLGGTSNHFRCQALRRLGGWDAWNVTEDADLGIRIARAGLLVADLPSSTHEEAPAVLKMWLGQRRRWLKGWMQTLITHCRQPRQIVRDLGMTASISLSVTIGSMIVGALGFPILSGAFAARLISATQLGVGAPIDWLLDALGLLVFCAGGCCIILPALLGLSRRRMMWLWPYAFALPIYALLISFAAWQAVFELIRAPFHWNKTEHGLSRSSLLRRPVRFWPLQAIKRAVP